MKAHLVSLLASALLLAGCGPKERPRFTATAAVIDGRQTVVKLDMVTGKAWALSYSSGEQVSWWEEIFDNHFEVLKMQKTFKDATDGKPKTPAANPN